MFYSCIRYTGHYGLFLLCIYDIVMKKGVVRMLISKKDLLAVTGISYGQLYRWKRERLIPEEWFMKQSSYTGQETFFPREQILSRIRSILDLKDHYTLEELAKMLSPEVAVSGYSEAEVKEITEIKEEIIDWIRENYHKDHYEYADIILLVAYTIFEKEYQISLEQRDFLLSNLLNRDTYFSMNGVALLLLSHRSEFFILMVKEQMPYSLDERLEVISKISLNNISNQLKLKYQTKFYS